MIDSHSHTIFPMKVGGSEGKRESAGGGARTHTILRSLDFESSASASSATPAAGIGKVASAGGSSSASRKIERLEAARRSEYFAENHRVAQTGGRSKQSGNAVFISHRCGRWRSGGRGCFRR